MSLAMLKIEVELSIKYRRRSKIRSVALGLFRLFPSSELDAEGFYFMIGLL